MVPLDVNDEVAAVLGINATPPVEAVYFHHLIVPPAPIEVLSVIASLAAGIGLPPAPKLRRINSRESRLLAGGINCTAIHDPL